MPTTPLQRMMFLQGQLCFFCNCTIPKSEASLEHLVPVSLGGSDHPDNLVACCRTLNALFGSMNVKDKVRAILRQNGRFTCPNQPAPTAGNQPPKPQPGKQPAAKAPAPQPSRTGPSRQVVDLISPTTTSPADGPDAASRNPKPAL